MVENSEGHQQPIIIVRRGNHGDHDDHHGGVWKVAFADFMTAMMAFFLVLWIVNSTSKETRSSVARYFNPLQLTNTTAARKGLKTPDESSFDADATDNKKDIVSPSGEKSTSSDNVKKKANGKASGDATAEAEDKKEKKDKHDKKDKKDKSAKKADGKAAQAEAAAAESKLLVRVVPPNTRQDTSKSETDVASAWQDTKSNPPAPQQPKKYRDPFAPLQPTIQRQGSRLQIDAKREPPTANRADNLPGSQVLERRHAGDKSDAAQATSKGAVKGTEAKVGKEGKKSDGVGGAGGTGEQSETLRAIQSLAADLSKDPNSPQIGIKLVKEGLLISLMDRANMQMFALNTSVLAPGARRTVEKIAGVLARSKAAIIIQGHTDARKFRSKTGNNWLLSASRAERTLAVLLRKGIAAERIEKIEGHADRMPRNPGNRFAAENRRIDILIRR